MMDTKSFTVVHEKLLPVSRFELSDSMDLAAVISADGKLSVFRTLSWEAVFSINSSDMITGSKPHIVRWNNSGTSLGLAFENGNVGIINVENAEFIGSKQDLSNDSINDINWALFRIPEESKLIPSRGYIVSCGGLQLVNRFGMAQLPETTIDNKSIIKSDLNEPSMLLSISRSGLISGYLDGVYPLFRVQSHRLLSNLLTVRCIVDESMCKMIISGHPSNNSTCVDIQSNTFLGISTVENCHNAYNLLVNTEEILSKLQESVTNFSRKWKESGKVILAKMQLLQGVLDGYALDLNPIEFMFTISECGLWHPAATSSFPNQWNDQGINRLRSAIDSTLLSIIKYMTLSAVPVVSNVILNCRELTGILKALQSQGLSGTHHLEDLQSDAAYLSASSQILRSKIEDLCEEARLTKDKMATFIQFIKEYSADPALAKTEAPDISLRKVYGSLFDPRHERASLTGQQAQAEAVTGTFLFTYLQVTESGQFKGRKMISQKSQDVLSHISEIAKLVEKSLSPDFPSSRLNELEKFRNEYSLNVIIKHCKDIQRALASKFQTVISAFMSQTQSSEKSFIINNPVLGRSVSFHDNTVTRKYSTSHHEEVESAQQEGHISWSAFVHSKDSLDEVLVLAQSISSEPEMDEQHSKVWRISLQAIDVNFSVSKARLLLNKNNEVELLIGGHSQSAVTLVRYTILTADGQSVPPSTNIDDICALATRRVSLDECRVRALDNLIDLIAMEVNGHRGIVIVGDSRNRLVVVDIDNDEDEEAEEDDDDCDENEAFAGDSMTSS